MKRRQYLESVAAVPFVSHIPIVSAADTRKTQDSSEGEGGWRASGCWLRHDECGEMMVFDESGELYVDGEYESYDKWRRVVQNNVHQVAGDVDYTADLFDAKLVSINMNPPYWRANFGHESGLEVSIRHKNENAGYDYAVYDVDQWDPSKENVGTLHEAIRGVKAEIEARRY